MPTPEQLSTLLARLARGDGAGPHRRAGGRGFVSSRRVRDEAVCDGTHSSQPVTSRQSAAGSRASRTGAPKPSGRRRAVSRADCGAAPLPPAGAGARGRSRRAAGARDDRSPRVQRRRRCVARHGPWRTSGDWWDAGAVSRRAVIGADRLGSRRVGRRARRWRACIASSAIATTDGWFIEGCSTDQASQEPVGLR